MNVNKSPRLCKSIVKSNFFVGNTQNKMHPYVGCIKLILIKSPPYIAKVLTLEAETFFTTWDILLYVVKQRTINSKPFHILANRFCFFCFFGDLCKELFLNVSSINFGIITFISKNQPNDQQYIQMCVSLFSPSFCMTNLKIWDLKFDTMWLVLIF